MNRKRKRIRINVIEKNDFEVSFKIIEQTAIYTGFGHGLSRKFRASNGLLLQSENCPEWSEYDTHKLFVRGLQSIHNNEIIKVSPNGFKLIEEAIDEYNRTFDSWFPKKGEGYYKIETKNGNYIAFWVDNKKSESQNIEDENFFYTRKAVNDAIIQKQTSTMSIEDICKRADKGYKENQCKLVLK